MATMKFFNVLDVPSEGAVDGTYYVKDGERVSTYIVSEGKVIPSDVDLKANHGYESNPKTLKEVEDDVETILTENKRKSIPFVYNTVGSKHNFKAEIIGNNLHINGALQYGAGFNFGSYSSEIVFDLSLPENYLSSYPRTYIYVLCKNDGVLGRESTLKLCEYTDYNLYPDYIPVMSIIKSKNTFIITNILGYKEEPDVPEFKVNKKIAEEQIAHSGELTLLDGVVIANGTFDADFEYGNIDFKTSKPIQISEGAKYLTCTESDIGRFMNYVNCYSEDNFEGFLGRSDNLSYYDLTSHPIDFRKLELKEGTKYISFLAYGNTNQINEVTIVTYESIEYTNVDIIYNGENYNIIDENIGIKSDVAYPYKPYQEATVRFQVPVNCYMADVDSNSIELQDGEDIHLDWGMLMLPESYTPNGKPTQLLIGCHGAGGTVSNNQSQTESTNLYKYLVANGFAVMDMNGLPESFATREGIDIKNSIGSPIAIQSYIKGAEWVFRNYNISEEGVLVNGGSMGGIVSSNLVMNDLLNIRAHGINCPVLDTYNHIWLKPWSGGLPKTALSKIYQFEEVDGSYVYDEEKLKGYNPILNQMTSYDKITGNVVDNIKVTTAVALDTMYEEKDYPCPIKIWHSVDDRTVPYAVSERHIKSIRNKGQIAYLRTIPIGDHAPTGVGTVLLSPLGNISYKGQTLSIKPIEEEILLWFKRFSI